MADNDSPNMGKSYVFKKDGDVWKLYKNGTALTNNEGQKEAQELFDFWKNYLKKLPDLSKVTYQSSKLESLLKDYGVQSRHYYNIKKESEAKGTDGKKTDKAKSIEKWLNAFEENNKNIVNQYKKVGETLEKLATYTAYNAKYMNELADRYKAQLLAQERISWINKINKNILAAAKKGEFFVTIKNIPESIYNYLTADTTNIYIWPLDRDYDPSNNDSTRKNATKRDFCRNNAGARYVLKGAQPVTGKDGKKYYDVTLSWKQREIVWAYCPTKIGNDEIFDYPESGYARTMGSVSNYTDSKYAKWHDYGYSETNPTKNWKKGSDGKPVSKIDDWYYNNWAYDVITPYELTPYNIYGQNITYPISEL